MGYDVSAHPVDVDLIQNRILPYVRGEGDLSDLVDDCVRLAQVRFRANGWGLGLVDLSHAESDAKRAKPKRGATNKKPQPLVPAAFDSDLHVWGRPFFITTASEHVSEAIDRYRFAKPKQVDKIAEGMLSELNPALVGKVTPSRDGKLPTAKQLRENAIFSLDFYRDAYPKLLTRESVTLPQGDEIPARHLFLHSLPLDVITFAAKLQPGWMSRGYVWFTAFIDRARLDAGKLVESAASLFQPLFKDVKGYGRAFERTITENYMLGGYVRPKNVPAFREWMEKHAERMVRACLKLGWDEAATRGDLQKIMEALRDAEWRKMGFVEASEVYSGPMGILN